MKSSIAPMRARVSVPAKINVFLRVEGLRDDGYHELVTVMQTVGLHDVVQLTTHGLQADDCPASVRVAFTHDGTPGVPSDESNLIVQAARVLLAELDVEIADVVTDTDAVELSELARRASLAEDLPLLSLHLAKNIPVVAGMAGGSADAAGALIALSALLECGFEHHRLRTLAAELGSDVPFCVTGGTAMATGTGTATADVLNHGRFHWVVGISNEPLSTPKVYAEWDRLDTTSGPGSSQVLQALRQGDAPLLGRSLHNDLQVAAFSLRPELADKVDHLLVEGALGAIVTGSGPTVVGLAEDAEHAHELARGARGRFDRVAVATSPAGGPQLRVG